MQAQIQYKRLFDLLTRISYYVMIIKLRFYLHSTERGIFRGRDFWK